MTPRQHVSLLLQAVGAWFAFWLAGLPDYYRQYSTVVMAVACILLSVGISLVAVALLRRGRPETRRSRAFWFSVYSTLPFAALDSLYCGWHLGRGAHYFAEYWYLTIFYVTPWLTFLPTAALMRSPSPEASRA